MTAGAVSAGHFRENSGQCTLPSASAGQPCTEHNMHTLTPRAELLDYAQCGLQLACL